MSLRRCVMTTHSKLELSNGQGWKGPPFARRLECPNYRVMSFSVDITTVRAALLGIMSRKHIKPTTLSLKAGKNRTLVKDLLEKTEDVSLGTLNKLAAALEVPVSDLLTPEDQRGSLPSGDALKVVLAEVLASSGGVSLAESKLRPVSEHLLLCLELLARNPAIQANPDAIKAVAQAAAARPHAATPEA